MVELVRKYGPALAVLITAMLSLTLAKSDTCRLECSFTGLGAYCNERPLMGEPSAKTEENPAENGGLSSIKEPN
jgi:hypothetical protein